MTRTIPYFRRGPPPPGLAPLAPSLAAVITSPWLLAEHSARGTSETLLRDLERPNQCLGFVALFFVLRRRVRIDHDARPGLHVRAALEHDDRTNRDAKVEIAGEIQIPHRARVEPAARRLQRLDDLHRADLRRARHGAGRKAR